MLVKKYGDVISGIFLLLVTAAYFSQISSIEIIDSASVDASFIPKIIAIILLILSASITMNGVLNLKKFKLDGLSSEEEKINWNKVILTTTLLIIYIALFVKIGFLLTTIFYLFAQLFVLAPKRTPKKAIQFILIAVVAAFILQFVFVNLLYVMLPEGLFR